MIYGVLSGNFGNIRYGWRRRFALRHWAAAYHPRMAALRAGHPAYGADRTETCGSSAAPLAAELQSDENYYSHDIMQKIKSFVSSAISLPQVIFQIFLK